MELIKLLQIKGISEATQEDIILNFLECIDEESALAIVEEYEQAEMSLTESIINEVSLGYALKKSLGGAVQRFKDIRKKQANVSTDRPIGLAGIRKQEAQKQDVVKSQERFKQAKDTAKDIVNRMFNTRYTRDTKVAKAPEVKTEATQTAKPEATQTAEPTATQAAKPAKTTKLAKTKTTKPATTQTAEPTATQTAKPAKTTKPAKTKITQTAEPTATQTAEPTATQTAKPAKTTKPAKTKTTQTAEPTATQTAEPTATQTAEPEVKTETTQEQTKNKSKKNKKKTETVEPEVKEDKQLVAVGAKEPTLSSSDREKLQKQLERLSNLPYSDKVAAKMSEIEKQLS